MTLQPKARRPRRAGIIDGLDMQKYEVGKPSGATECLGTIAWITRDKVAAGTAISMMMMDTGFLKPGQYIKKYIIVGNVLTFQRNSCIQQMEGDWLLFIDSDMTWQPDAIKTLVETREKWDLDIIGALCFQRSEPFQPTLYKLGDRARLDEETSWSGYTFLEKWPEDSAVEVDATGMAFCLIHKRVFDRILQQQGGERFPEFDERTKYKPIPFFRWEEEWGEDFLFCREAKASGSRIFVDTGVKVGHVGDQTFTEETFLREIAHRHPDAEAFRKGVLESIGEEVLTSDEAVLRLEPWRKTDA